MVSVTIFWNSEATRRAGYTADDLLPLSEEPTPADVVRAFLANLPEPRTTAAAPTKVFYTASAVAAIVARHPHLFGGSA